MAQKGTGNLVLALAIVAEAFAGFACWAIVIERLVPLPAAVAVVCIGAFLVAHATRRLVNNAQRRE
jgi:hypothetical protein